jgi:hypothetical protein
MRFSGRLSYLLVVAFALAIAGTASNAMADTRTKTVGNTSGNPFTFKCPPGEALIGWAYNSTDHMTLIAPMCQKVEMSDDGFGLVGAGPTAAPDAGYGAVDPNAHAGDPILCPDAGVMRSMQVLTTSTLRVHSVRMTCKGPHVAPTLVRPTLTSGGPAIAKASVSCDSRTSYATGLFGTVSKSLVSGGVMSLGLFCFSGDQPKSDDTADAGDKAQPADTGDDKAQPADTGDNDTKTADTGDQNQPDMADSGDQGDLGNLFGNLPFKLQINIGGNGLNFGPKGKSRVLKDASTLYSDKGNTEIAYFDKGDKVVVVGCENKGQGWCQVIKPKQGLIWGGDLK